MAERTTGREYRILSPTAILGYGFPAASFERGLEENPDLIAVDAGSTDPGPYYLGAGTSFTDRAGVKRDLRFMLKAGVERGIPVVVGTAGGAGARPHVQWCREIVEELAAEEGLSFRLGVIHADIEKPFLIEAVRRGRVSPLDGLPELTESGVEEAARVVAQMGMEPFIRAHRAGCRVILAGRAYDPAVFSAIPVELGFAPGPAVHLGKILECAAIAADPGSGADCVLGILEEESFILQPLSGERRFTRTSVAAHSLYEKSDPFRLPGPGGVLELSDVRFEEIGEGRVRVRGSRYVASERPNVKLEGVRLLGHRTVSFAGSRDPIMIQGIDGVLEGVRRRVEDLLRAERIEGRVWFHVYGRDGVMDALEPDRETPPKEIGIVIEALAPTRTAAATVCSLTRSTLLHYGYPGRISTAGNLAFPFSPSDLDAGPAFEFSIYHLLDIAEAAPAETAPAEAADGEELFPLEVVEIGAGEGLPAPEGAGP